MVIVSCVWILVKADSDSALISICWTGAPAAGSDSSSKGTSIDLLVLAFASFASSASDDGSAEAPFFFRETYRVYPATVIAVKHANDVAVAVAAADDIPDFVAFIL
jgi:hypothetical protein